MFEPLLSLLEANLIFFVISVALLSLIVGSFLNVVIYRLPKMMESEWQCDCRELLKDELKTPSKPQVETQSESQPEQQAETKTFNLAKPDSHCPSCNTPIKAWQNIPVISYLLLKGKCANCQTKISKRYPAIELLTAFSSAIVAYQFGFSAQSLVLIPLTWAFICLIFIDIDKMLLPDQITIPLLWGVLIAANWNVFLTPMATIFGAVAGYLFLWTVYWLFKLVTGKEGMGHGDFKLLAVIGAVVGVIQLPMVILMSSIVGAIVGIGLMFTSGAGRNTEMPFGPYLAIAGWIVMLWGDQIFNWYIGLM
ncbi:type 4 prepilin-like proteins leader peptide-processing enzyme [Psychrosphaera saromensis]|uniref:Prepilin leader peptidase/N-methyltransferase n=1 Tax=Psychrosphaera saromensis TaxID=716813 RepID=A0A2S7UQN9_9GAMM|nr:A24 family peptidase [Psychrosphaera saromensis]PQJ52286.1 prepilin peptidase [Psychrosphaera saromensis]GHB72484.1 type 4 prepilin-like proteins leader peptide-processing enzyme [Psychrosphaera saromensis]GLQ13563.1 type 4 prepilin-like proteins leader peptide-processing enzyme [Psychrosphaera saromensis]